MSTSPEIVPCSEMISQTAQEGLGVGGQEIAKSEMREIGSSGETRQQGQEGLRVGQHMRMWRMPEVGQSDVETSQPAQEGLGVGGQVIAKSEMREIGHSGETRQPGQEGLRVGQHMRMWRMPEVGQSDVETLQPVESGTLNPKPFPEWFYATEPESVEVQSSEELNYSYLKDPKWFDAIEKKNCKLLLQLLKSDPNRWEQTGHKGRSVLHVAVMQGCSELVRELHEGDFPCWEKRQTPFEFLWENARDGRLKDASAQDIWLVMEGPSVKIENEMSCERFLDGTPDLVGLFQYRGDPVDPVDGRSRDDYYKSHVMCSMSIDSEMLSLREAISQIASEKQFVMDENDVDFNFEDDERKELYVHMACNMLRNLEKEEVCKSFIVAVIEKLREKNLLQRLFDQMDAQGRTILQILVSGAGEGNRNIGVFLRSILEILPDACVNTLHKAERTILHWAVGHNYIFVAQDLLDSGKVKLDVTFQTQYYWDMTPLNLLLLYNYDWDGALHLMVKDQLNRPIGRRNFRMLVPKPPTLDTLSWAVLMGKKHFVEEVMRTEEYQKYYLHEKRLLSYAAYFGDVEILQLVLQKTNVQFNTFYDPFESPPLHLAIEPTVIAFSWLDFRNFNDYLHCNDFISIKLLEDKLQEKNREENSAKNREKYRAKYREENSVIANRNDMFPWTKEIKYNARKVCANLLLQAGADILATDKKGHMADPGKYASNEGRIWWYDLVTNQIGNIKNDLNVAGSGTAVVAALVATTSFVGPFTPPLNYVAMSSGTTTIDVGVQVTELLIKVFLVSNGLSFYLAIISIMLALMPSLPIPKEGLVFGPCDDLKRSQRTISIAIAMLLASIISVLISFAASSLLVVPSQHRRLMAYSTSIGGLICSIGIFFFFLRFLRLIRPQNTFIRKWYQRIGKL